jgi:hypothetical protein
MFSALLAANSFKRTDTVLLVGFIGFGVEHVIANNLANPVKE